jgi:hypothetical protein
MKYCKPLPAASVLADLLAYDPDTGALVWKERTPVSAKQPSQWNAKYAGKTFNKGADGYHRVAIFEIRYPAHRIIWKMVYGADPEIIDHVNGDRSDNRLSNLRSVSFADNCRNRKIPNSNSSGTIGVYFNKHRQKWQASIRADGKLMHLGVFENISEAISARQQASIKYGYHANHGRPSDVV